jgi:hypothetical protein
MLGFSKVAFEDANAIVIFKYTGIVGLVLSALFQHWAYYKIYKPSKKQSKEKKQNQSIHAKKC